MDKVDVTAVGDTFKQRRILLLDFQVVPAHMRNLEAVAVGEALYGTRNQPQTFVDSVFLADLKEHLHTQAYSENRTLLHVIVKGALHRRKLLHALGEGTDAREEDAVGVCHNVQIRGYYRVRARLLKSFLYASEISQTVIKYNYLCHPHRLSAATAHSSAILRADCSSSSSIRASPATFPRGRDSPS